MLTFVLPRATRVVFLVNQLSPSCRASGRFSVAGHPGLNRVRFGGRVSGRRLGPGTYRISARTTAGRPLRRVTIVIVERAAPSRGELQAARASNVCGATRSTSSVLRRHATPAQLASSNDTRPSTPAEQSVAAAPTGENTHSGAVLGSAVERTARAVRPFLVALLAGAILLLGLASLPRVAVPDPRLNDVLARHRTEIATVGVVALVAVAVAFLLG